jgi:hypothetical protein
MADYTVVKKNRYYKTVLITDAQGYLDNGFEEVKDYVLVRTSSTDLLSRDGFAYMAVPVGIDQTVVRIETMYPADMGKPADEIKVPEDIIIIGINEPVPAEIDGTPEQPANNDALKVEIVEPKQVELPKEPQPETPGAAVVGQDSVLESTTFGGADAIPASDKPAKASKSKA